MQLTRSIPHVAAPPLIGSAWPLMKDAPAFFLREHRRHGSVFSFSAMGRRYTVLAGREANLFATKRGADCFSSAKSWSGLNKAYGTRDTIISRDGPAHRSMRKIQQSGYSRSRMEGKMGALRRMTLRELYAHMGRPIAVHELMQRLLSLQLGYLTMGVQRTEQLKDLSYFLRTTLACTVTRQRPSVLLRTPKYKRAHARCMDFAQDMLRGVSPEDDNLLGDLMRAHLEDPEVLPKAELLSCALAPFVAGLDTAASTLAFAFFHLSSREDLLSQIRSQSDAYFLGQPTLQGLTQLDASYCTLLETLRCDPIAPALSRTTAREFTFDGCTIGADESVILATTITHHDARYFPDPERFDIDRYRAPRGEHRQAGAYVPFGVGPHICLGAGMAQALMLFNVNMLVHAFILEFHGASQGLKIERVPNARPADSFQLTLKPRVSLFGPRRARDAANDQPQRRDIAA